MIDMPNLTGFSYRNAMMNLTSLGLSADTTYKADFAKNSVLEQLYKDEPIAPGTKIRMGSRVTLVLGTGVGEMFYSVPNLVGRTYGEAKSVLEANGVNLFVLSAQGVTDTLNSYIIDQDPKRYNEEGEPLRIRSGQFISVKLSTERPVTADSTINNQPLQ